MLTVMISRSRSTVASAIALFRVGEGDGLAADREVASLRPADVVVGHQDPGQVRVAAEGDAEEVVGLALLGLGGGEEVDAGVDLWQDSGARRARRGRVLRAGRYVRSRTLPRRARGAL